MDPGDHASREQIVANTTLMLSGGLQEPRDVIALTLWALLSNREQFEQVWADRSLVKAAVEETLRWAGPVGTATRQTTREVELAGVARARRVDRRGALVGQPRPAPVDRPRPLRRASHGGRSSRVSAGTHFCLGAWFGRHLARVTLDLALDRLPGLELDPDRPVTLSGWEFRAPDSLWVTWHEEAPRA
ncbi:MAG TPA: hypothetical protein VG993_10150 [Actinomycetota bacterium]|nr:hypothetical protein [Actinomycetota bacterium]